MAGILKKVKDSGSPDRNCNVLVYFSEGYQAGQQAQFDADVAAKVDYYFKDATAKDIAYKFNAYSVFLPSVDSGISNPKPFGTQPVVDANTYFKCSFWATGIQREIAPKSNVQVLQEMINNIPGYTNQINYEPIILCNSPYYGGSEVGDVSCTTLHADSNEVLLHENLGHVIAGLGDEAQGQHLVEAWNGTMTLPVRWDNLMVHPYTPVQRTQISGGITQTWYVPTDTCKMKALYQPFCIVCAHQINLAVDQRITRSGGTVPTGHTPPPPPPPLTQPVITKLSTTPGTKAFDILFTNVADTAYSEIFKRVYSIGTSNQFVPMALKVVGGEYKGSLANNYTWQIEVQNFDSKGKPLGTSLPLIVKTGH